MIIKNFEERLRKYFNEFEKVVVFDKEDRFLLFDLTKNNTELTQVVLNDTTLFSQYINEKLENANVKFGVGGYAEHRTIYSRSEVFDTEEEEPRRLHLGIDIWGAAETPVYAPLNGTIHSFGFNDAFGDYGATLIVQHQIEEIIFHTLYGHLSLKSIQDIKEGDVIEKGQWIASFGIPTENGHWPPHLHFQIIIDMQGWKGDYPGVCKFSERATYLENCPDPDIILNMMQQATVQF